MLMPPLSTERLHELKQLAIDAALEAGYAIMAQRHTAFQIDTKTTGTSLASQVVTEIDLLSERIILEKLRLVSRRYDIGLLSEETPDDGSRFMQPCFWCIDPLDGTLPFIEGIAGFSVVIALVARDGAPLIGVIYDPLGNRLFHAAAGLGAWLNDNPYRIDSKCNQLTLITDRSFRSDPLSRDFDEEILRKAQVIGFDRVELILQGGAALNACQAALSAPACYFKFPKPQQGGGSPWDYAASQCWIHEAGGIALNASGQPLDLNPMGNLFFNEVGVLFGTHTQITDLLIRYHREQSQIF